MKQRSRNHLQLERILKPPEGSSKNCIIGYEHSTFENNIYKALF